MRYKITRFDKEMAGLAMAAYHTSPVLPAGWQRCAMDLSKLPFSADARELLRSYQTESPIDCDRQGFPTWIKLFYNVKRNTLVFCFEGSRFQQSRLFRPNEWNQVMTDVRADVAIAKQGLFSGAERTSLQRTRVARELVKVIAAHFIADEKNKRNTYLFWLLGAQMLLIALSMPLLSFVGMPKHSQQWLFSFLFVVVLIIAFVAIKNTDPHVHLAGHSLGGNVAEDVALELEVYDSTTFESPGVSLANSRHRAQMKSFVCETLISGALRHHGMDVVIARLHAGNAKLIPVAASAAQQLLENVLLDVPWSSLSHVSTSLKSKCS